MKDNMSVHMPAQFFWLEISFKYECSGLKVRICDDYMHKTSQSTTTILHGT